MSQSTYSIIPVSEADLSAIGLAVFTSKLPLTINRLLFKDWPNESAQKALYATGPVSSFKDPNTQMWKVVDDGNGELIGHCVLARKIPTEEGKEEGEQKTVPDGVNPEVFETIMKAGRELDEEMKGVEHFGLTHIYIKMSHRNRGIGTRLIQMCIDAARDAGLPLLVMSEPAAYDLYLKIGFKDTKHVDIDLAQWAPKYCGFGIFRLSRLVMDETKSSE